jgi:hypothetical protein
MIEKIGCRVELSAMLKDLGATPEDVATALKAEGIRGVRNAARFLNPIVRYAQGRVMVDALGLDVMKSDTLRLIFHDGQKEEAPLPLAVRQFLDAFNRGKYPELELPPDRTGSGTTAK